MQGVGIFNGDLLIVDRSLTAKNGDVIVANYNGCFVCKLIDKTQVLLLSVSSKHPPVQIKPEDSVKGTSHIKHQEVYYIAH